MTQTTMLKTWEHDIQVNGYDIYISIREDNHVAVTDYYYEDDPHSISCTIPSNIDPNNLLYHPISAKELEQFKTNELTDLQEGDLIEFFWDYLNEYPIFDDPIYRYNDEPTDDFEIFYTASKYDSLPEVDVKDIAQAIVDYYNLDYVEFYITNEETSMDADCLVFSKFLELLESVITVEGCRYEYNDGAYDRYSGYSKEGDTYYIESQIDTELPPIEFMKLIQTDPKLLKIITDSKRTIITWLKKYQPLNIRNLKQLEKYILT